MFEDIDDELDKYEVRATTLFGQIAMDMGVAARAVLICCRKIGAEARSHDKVRNRMARASRRYS